MNKRELAKNLKQYDEVAKGKTHPEFRAILIEDGFPEKDADQIADVMFEVEGSAEEDEAPAKTHYQEWKVQILNGKAEKLKVIRECVKITDEQAETLNSGVIDGGNTYASMYFKAE